MTLNKRQFLAGATAAAVFTPAILRAQTATIRWGAVLAPTHPGAR